MLTIQSVKRTGKDIDMKRWAYYLYLWTISKD